MMLDSVSLIKKLCYLPKDLYLSNENLIPDDISFSSTYAFHFYNYCFTYYKIPKAVLAWIELRTFEYPCLSSGTWGTKASDVALPAFLWSQQCSVIQLLKMRHNNPLLWLAEGHRAELRVHSEFPSSQHTPHHKACCNSAAQSKRGQCHRLG